MKLSASVGKGDARCGGRRGRARGARGGRRSGSRPAASAATTDADAHRALDTPIYVDHRLDSHDRGTIYVVEAGEGPPIVLSHGVTLSVRTWFHQLELLPKAGFRAHRVSTIVATESPCSAKTGTRSTTSPRT